MFNMEVLKVTRQFKCPNCSKMLSSVKGEFVFASSVKIFFDSNEELAFGEPIHDKLRDVIVCEKCGHETNSLGDFIEII